MVATSGETQHLLQLPLISRCFQQRALGLENRKESVAFKDELEVLPILGKQNLALASDLIRKVLALCFAGCSASKPDLMNT